MLEGVPRKGVIFDTELGDYLVFKVPGDMDEKGVRGERLVHLKEAYVVGCAESGAVMNP